MYEDLRMIIFITEIHVHCIKTQLYEMYISQPQLNIRCFATKNIDIISSQKYMCGYSLDVPQHAACNKYLNVQSTLS